MPLVAIAGTLIVVGFFIRYHNKDSKLWKIDWYATHYTKHGKKGENVYKKK